MPCYRDWPSLLLLLLLTLIVTTEFGWTKVDEANFSCKTHGECARKIGQRWKSYKFVCCTSVLCDENYGDYYIAHSGCATERNCRPQVLDSVGTSTTYAARMYASTWFAVVEGNVGVVDNCPRTRAAFTEESIKKAQKNKKPEPILPPIDGKPFIDKSQCSSVADECARKRQQCCLQIDCRSEQAGGFSRKYDLQAICRSSCFTTTRQNRLEYTFFFSPEVWDRRPEYREAQAAPWPNGTCDETRLFYFWARRQPSKTNG